MIRCFDFLFSLIGLIILLPLIILIFFIGLFDSGSPLFIQSRVGSNLKSFSLILLCSIFEVVDVFPPSL